MSTFTGIIPLCLSCPNGRWVFEFEYLVSQGPFFVPAHRTVDDPQLISLAINSLSDRLRKAARRIMSEPTAHFPKDGYVPLDGKWVPAQWAELLGRRRPAARKSTTSKVAALRQQVEALRKENRVLRRDNDALAEGLVKLNQRVAQPAVSGQISCGAPPPRQAGQAARQSYRAETQA